MIRSNEPLSTSLKKRLGQSIVAKRKELNLDILMLSDYSKVSPSLISKIENGKANVTLETLEKILNVLGLDLTIDVKKR